MAASVLAMVLMLAVSAGAQIYSETFDADSDVTGEGAYTVADLGARWTLGGFSLDYRIISQALRPNEAVGWQWMHSTSEAGGDFTVTDEVIEFDMQFFAMGKWQALAVVGLCNGIEATGVMGYNLLIHSRDSGWTDWYPVGMSIQRVDTGGVSTELAQYGPTGGTYDDGPVHVVYSLIQTGSGVDIEVRITDVYGTTETFSTSDTAAGYYSSGQGISIQAYSGNYGVGWGTDARVWMDNITVDLPPGPPTDCTEVVEAGYRINSDLNEDCYVEWADFGMFAAEWQMCNDPTDGSCTPNW